MENIIRIRRKELGLSQEQLARKCDVSRQTVNAIENNKYDPDPFAGLSPRERAAAHRG